MERWNVAYSSSSKAVWRACAIAMALALVGCSTSPQYQGASPSFRSVSGYPDTRNSYVGMNFNFVVDQPGSTYLHPGDPAAAASTATASASAAE